MSLIKKLLTASAISGLMAVSVFASDSELIKGK